MSGSGRSNKVKFTSLAPNNTKVKKQDKSNGKIAFKNFQLEQRESLYIRTTPSYAIGSLPVVFVLAVIQYAVISYTLSDTYIANFTDPASKLLVQVLLMSIAYGLPAFMYPDTPLNPFYIMSKLFFMLLKIAKMTLWGSYGSMLCWQTVTNCLEFAIAYGGAVGGVGIVAWFNGSNSIVGQPVLQTVALGTGTHTKSECMFILGAWTFISTLVYWRMKLHDYDSYRVDPNMNIEKTVEYDDYLAAIFGAFFTATSFLISSPIIGADIDLLYAIATATIANNSGDTGFITGAMFIGFAIALAVIVPCYVFVLTHLNWLRAIGPYEKDEKGEYIVDPSTHRLQLKAPDVSTISGSGSFLEDGEGEEDEDQST